MNSFFGLGPMELVVIVFIALIVLGPQRLPGTIREVMKYWRYFRNLSGELTSQLGEEFKDLEDLSPQRMLEDLAKELDDEAAQTKEAANLKKKPTSKASTSKSTKSTAAKSSTATKKTAAASSQTASTETASSASSASDTSSDDAHGQSEATDHSSEQSPKRDSTAAASASAAAAAAMAAGGSHNPEVVGDQSSTDGQASDSAQESSAKDSQPAQPTAQNGDIPAATTEPENTILPPDPAEDTAEDAEVAMPDAKSDGVDDDEEDSGGKSGSVTKPATVSVNGKGARPEDTG